MRLLITAAAALLAALSVPGPAYADLEPVDPLPGAATTLQAPAAEPVAPWQTLAERTPFHPDTALLLTDGTVMAQDYATADWWRLRPDEFGKYIDGTWTQLPPMPDDYAPYDYCSAVLADGRVIVEGGEYTYVDGVATATETNQGAIYDPVANSWQVLDPPPGWTKIGDSSCLVLPNGKFLLARSFNSTPLGQVALLDPDTLSWTVLAPPGKVDSSAEENWTLLPDGTVLTVDIHAGPGAERFIPPWLDGSANGEWISAGTIPADLVSRRDPGPQVLLPDGTVFAVGDTGANAKYSPPTTLYGTGTWTVAPSFPTVAGGQLDVCDGPAVLLTNGSVLVGASPGEVLVTFDNRTAWIYTSTGSPDPSWAPSITTCPVPDDPTRPGEEGTPGSVIAPGATYTIAGRQLNGVSQAENYGDDEAAATNYPLVRITNHATGHVFYARTHDHSSMGVATGDQIVSTHFDVPAGLERGASDLVVVANGIASNRCVVNEPAAGTQ